MKGAPGVIVAGILGLLAFVANWVYLETKTGDIDSVSFIGIKTTVQVGQPIKRDQLEEVEIPTRFAEQLKRYVYLYDDVDTVIGIPASRELESGQLFLRKDYVTPPRQLELAQDEFVFWVTVDSRAIVPELINPGDKISFHLPVLGADGEPSATIEEIGPFRVKSLGNRLASSNVMRATRRSPSQEQKIGIVVLRDERSEEYAQFRKVQERLLRGGMRNVTVTLHAS